MSEMSNNEKGDHKLGVPPWKTDFRNKKKGPS